MRSFAAFGSKWLSINRTWAYRLRWSKREVKSKLNIKLQLVHCRLFDVSASGKCFDQRQFNIVPTPMSDRRRQSRRRATKKQTIEIKDEPRIAAWKQKERTKKQMKNVLQINFYYFIHRAWVRISDHTVLSISSSSSLLLLAGRLFVCVFLSRVLMLFTFCHRRRIKTVTNKQMNGATEQRPEYISKTMQSCPFGWMVE